jgi:hypothetical protein
MTTFKGLTCLFIVVLFLVVNNISYSQCSDAGVCTLGSHKQQEEEEANSNSSVSLTGRIGYSGKDDDVTYNSITVSGSFGLTNNLNASFSIPFNMQSGPAGDFSGIGDLIIGVSLTQPLDKKSSIDVKLGGKFATGNANQGTTPGGTSLPLIYQSGMGTNDILLGVTYNYDDFSATLGGQIPLDRSKNEFSQVKRGTDLLLGLGYTLEPSRNFFVTGEVITIKRLSQSNIILGGAEFDVPDSDFLQMNIQISTNYIISNNFGVNFSGAIPLMKRETNVDGTKRAFTVSAGASYFFKLGV